MSEQAHFGQRVDLRRILAEQGLDDNGASPHSWRCEHLDRYPDYCTCVDDIIDAILASDAIRQIRAAAWDEGHGATDEHGPGACECPNPYRTEVTA